MHVAVVSFKIKLFGISSLKEKRSLIKRLMNELRSKYNVSVSEVGMCNSKGWAEIGIAVVNSAKEVVDSTVEQISNVLESTYGLQIVDLEREGW
ncbi:MAG: Uncharacterized protein XD58_0120 [Thermotoga sp. 50_1627]|uniref:DUF503 domain-containing protein n=1 Tax=Pseudothermotoga sp. TaxID=2033661 RepID=UPI00076D46A6|nr:MAG: Uncharacterized protein XD45_0109 [Thermotoga sp. 50_64]KUK25959.1 MAG: Uncharacterized protein XD58_0120 [Thermotoga sp. 50_1627]MBC7116058.1 DUF503 domain-containing protein [Pseudothermotoga sp.]MDK2922648.1 uncharacterized protein [Pseudothermotoga sp.]HBT38622.1 DUF503 domain-containing protein [Pseudothermotoga sp.]